MRTQSLDTHPDAERTLIEVIRKASSTGGQVSTHGFKATPEPKSRRRLSTLSPVATALEWLKSHERHWSRMLAGMFSLSIFSQ